MFRDEVIVVIMIAVVVVIATVVLIRIYFSTNTNIFWIGLVRDEVEHGGALMPMENIKHYIDSSR